MTDERNRTPSVLGEVSPKVHLTAEVEQNGFLFYWDAQFPNRIQCSATVRESERDFHILY
jgi:hypothetical protein